MSQKFEVSLVTDTCSILLYANTTLRIKTVPWTENYLVTETFLFYPKSSQWTKDNHSYNLQKTHNLNQHQFKVFSYL